MRLHRRRRRASGLHGAVQGRSGPARPPHPAHGRRRPVRRGRRARAAKSIWLHTFGERFADPRPVGPRRRACAEDERPDHPQGRRDPRRPRRMPDDDQATTRQQRLLIGDGLSSRTSRPRSGATRSPASMCCRSGSATGKSDRQPPHHRRPPPAVAAGRHPARPLARRVHDRTNQRPERARPLVELEPRQADLLYRICAGPTISADALAIPAPAVRKRGKRKNEKQGELIG